MFKEVIRTTIHDSSFTEFCNKTTKIIDEKGDEMNSKRSILLVTAALMVITMLFAACQPTAAPTPETIVITQEGQTIVQTVEVQVEVTPTAAPIEKAGGTFTWGVASEPESMSPLHGNDWTDLYVFGMVSEPLTWGGENYPSELKPVLATSWESNADHTVWTIHLRQGVKWHNGSEFTADDVLFWAQAVQDPATNAFYFSDRFYYNNIPHVFEKIDDYTVKVTTAGPTPNLMNDICLPIIPKYFFEENNISNADIATSIAGTEGTPGTGPFKVVQYSPGEGIVLEKNPDYWGGEPLLDQIVLRIIPDPDSMVTALLTGEIDWAYITPGQVPQLLNNGSVDVIPLLLDSSYWVSINNAKPMLKDVRTRQAMMYALDRQSILVAMQQGYGEIMSNPFPNVVSAWESLGGYEYNPDKAAELLAEVGWAMGSDGVLVAQNVEGVDPGTRFSLEYWHTGKNNLPTLIESYFKAVGIEVNQRIVDSATYNSENTGKENKPFDLANGSAGWLGTNASAWARYYANDSIAASPSSFVDPQVVDLFLSAKGAPDQASADEFYKQAAQIIWDELPTLPLYQRAWIFAKSNRLHTEDAGLNTAQFSLFTQPQYLWVEK
jgi:peptide/nickel transport system substrate-binding protein